MNVSIPEKYKSINGSMLKTIAVITMFIDHFALVILYWGILYPNQPISDGTDLYFIYKLYNICRGIGRIAFPIFCFLLIEGFVYTSNRKKYALRLALFAVISEIPFNLAVAFTPFTLESQNVFFTLLIGLLTMWAMEKAEQKNPALILLPAVIGCLIAHLIQCDYGYRGIILIVLLYIFRHNRIYQALAGSLSLYWEWEAIFAFLPICLYNGKKGWNMKYFTYIFYPAHLLLLYLAARYLL